MKWSQLRKRVKDTMADSVRDRIDLGATTYRPSREVGRAWIAIDGCEIASMMDCDCHGSDLTMGLGELEAVRCDWKNSLEAYLSLSINDILASDNPIIRAIGMLDARLGKRRLAAMDAPPEHDLVRRMYDLRCETDRIRRPPNAAAIDLTARLDRRAAVRRERNEQRALARRDADAALVQKRSLRRVETLLAAIERGDLTQDEAKTPIAQLLWTTFAQSRDFGRLREFLQVVGTRSKLLRSPQLLRGVLALEQDSAHWLRPAADWAPDSHNARRQFSSLARHLLARFPVPVFMDAAWIEGDEVQQQWFRRLGDGRNMSTAENLPLPLTKKMAHHFLQAPDDYSIGAAFRWGQVHALGGNSQLASALRETRLVREFRDDPFWLSVLRFFIKNPMLDPAHVGPIVDYIWNQRFEPQTVFVARGVAEERAPIQPHFSMRGRTAEALLREVDAWHVCLGKESLGGDLQWRKSDIQEFRFDEGSSVTQNLKVWRIQELLSSAELMAEGRQMHHCVASYARSCDAGKCTIWAMSCEADAEKESVLTIEVDPASREVRQVRGKYDRLAREAEKSIIRRWTEQEGLRLASYI